MRLDVLPQDLHVRRACWALVILYLVLWTGVPALTHTAPALDIAEGYIWGIEWQAGYYKHPPLSPWLTAASTTLLGRNLWAVSVISPLVTVICFMAIWFLARQFLDERMSLVSVYLASSQLYLNLLIPEFNHNTMQTPLWAAAFATAWFAFSSHGVVVWAALGTILGLCVLAKYSAALLIATLGVFATLSPSARRSLSLTRVALCIFAACLVAGTNLAWQFENDLPALRYLGDRLGDADSTLGHMANAVRFSGAQLMALAPILAVAAWCFWRRPVGELGVQQATKADLGGYSAYLWVTALAPFAVSVVVIVVTGKSFKSMWGTMMFPTLALAFVAWRPAAFANLFSRRAWLFWLCLQALMLLTYVVMMRWGPIHQHKVSKALFPMADLATQLDKAWTEQTRGARLRYVLGDTWTGGVMAFGLPSAPSVMIDADPAKSPWVSAEQLRDCGALLVWPANRPLPGWAEGSAQGAPSQQVSATVVGHPELEVTLRYVVRKPAGDCVAK